MLYTVYSVLEQHDAGNDLNFFTAGPWFHGQHFGDGSSLGDLDFRQNTAKQFRDEVLKPFLRHFLHADGTELPSPVTVFETGSNQWKSFENWLPVEEEMHIFLHHDGALTLTAPSKEKGYTEYLRDPAHPVPYEPRPIWEINYDNPPAAGEPHLPAGTPHHGAGPEQLVPLVRPQPADLCTPDHVRSGSGLKRMTWCDLSTQTTITKAG